MTVRWDALLVRHVARELDGLLSGTRLRALRLDASSRDLVLFLRERTLVWRLHPTRGSLLLRGPTEPGPEDLRLPMRVRAVTAPADERLLRIQLLPLRGGRRSMDLVVELVGNRWNALVTEGPEARIRHVLVTREGSREQAVGGRWEPPDPSPRRGVGGDLPLEAWRALLDGVSGGAARRALVSSVAWTSPLNAPALLADPEGGWRLWRRMADPEAEARPVVLATEKGSHPYPFPLPHVSAEASPTLLEAFSRAGAAEGDTSPGAALLLPPPLLRALERTLDGLRRRLTSLEAERAGLGDPEALRARGDLLLARFHEVPTGRDRVVLTGFEGDPVEVELDPALPPQENADRYYDEAARTERARERIPRLEERTRERLRALAALEERVQAGEATREEVEEALPPEALASGPDSGRGDERSPSLPYRRFRSTGGLEIRVGKGPKENDDLTFHHSSPDDVWLHAQQVPGAHVILRWGRSEPPPSRDLAEAAVLAALHSKARSSGSVPVQWTFRKYVRSPRKAPPGLVVPDRVRTLFVEPDAAVAERLAAEE